MELRKSSASTEAREPTETRLASLYLALIKRASALARRRQDTESARLLDCIAGPGVFGDLRAEVGEIENFVPEAYIPGEFPLSEIFSIWVKAMSAEQLEKAGRFLEAFERDLTRAEALTVP